MILHFQSAAKRGVLLVLSAACLALWSLALLETANARYLTRASDGTAVRVASFSVEADPVRLDSPDAVLDCNIAGDQVRYALKIRNRSEVDVRYRVVLNGVPSSIRLETENAEGELAACGAETEAILCFSVSDPSDRTQDTSVDGVSITVYAEQKGGGE